MLLIRRCLLVFFSCDLNWNDKISFFPALFLYKFINQMVWISWNVVCKSKDIQQHQFTAVPTRNCRFLLSTIQDMVFMNVTRGIYFRTFRHGKRKFHLWSNNRTMNLILNWCTSTFSYLILEQKWMKYLLALRFLNDSFLKYYMML